MLFREIAADPWNSKQAHLFAFFHQLRAWRMLNLTLTLNLLKRSGGGGRGSGLDNGMFHSWKDNAPNDKSKAHLIITFSGIVVHLGG